MAHRFGQRRQGQVRALPAKEVLHTARLILLLRSRQLVKCSKRFQSRRQPRD
jgi:hypothetical protein